MNTDIAVTVLTDMLCAAADDLSFPLTRRSADRLADRALELLELAGWHLTHDPWLDEQWRRDQQAARDDP